MAPILPLFPCPCCQKKTRIQRRRCQGASYAASQRSYYDGGKLRRRHLLLRAQWLYTPGNMARILTQQTGGDLLPEEKWMMGRNKKRVDANAAESEEALERRIGHEIRRHRVACQLSTSELAKRAGISKGFLSKLERGAKAPAISTLIQLAAALRIKISMLLEPDHRNESVSFVKREERPPRVHYASAFGYKYSALVRNFDSKHMEPFIISYPRNPKRNGAGLQHAGEEFLMVIKGKLVFTLGRKEYLLRPGDALYFDSNIPHWGRSFGEDDAEALDISFVSNNR